MGIKDDMQEFEKGCNISKDHPYTGFTSEKCLIVQLGFCTMRIWTTYIVMI